MTHLVWALLKQYYQRRIFTRPLYLKW